MRNYLVVGVGGTVRARHALYDFPSAEATATFTQTHRLKIWLNGVEFWWGLDAV